MPHGETWTCETCGRRWNTAQIPADAYDRRRRRMRRFELEVLGFGVLILALFVPLVLFVSSAYLCWASCVAAAWMFLYMPFWRRRVRRAAAEAPQLGSATGMIVALEARAIARLPAPGVDDAGRPVLLATLEAPLTPEAAAHRGRRRGRVRPAADRRQRGGVEPRALWVDARLRHHRPTRRRGVAPRACGARPLARRRGRADPASLTRGRWARCSSSWPSEHRGCSSSVPIRRASRPGAIARRLAGSATR